MNATAAHAGAPASASAVALVVHDVAPATWPDCQRLIAAVESITHGPLTLLVVPHFHGGRAAADEAAFVAALDARRARGDELVLHGYYHRDDAPPPRSLRGFVERRLLTRREGEFAAIDLAEARTRLAAGIALFRDHGWPLRGFVPPAWLLNDATRVAIDRSGHPFEWVAVRRGLYRLPGWQLERTANYVYSPDRAWRRWMSRGVLAREMRAARDRPLLRISLHPADSRVPQVMAHWCALIEGAVRTRRVVTKSGFIAEAATRRERPSHVLAAGAAR
ncbi:MAG: polysaccharide deacetylase family protein [Proteobacteria bacterium]|nr:polysaccharide deacetylase family protein [Pseudomonadota bacterium]